METWQSVLVLGASGGVGSYAVQIAKSLGAKVTGACSTAKTGFVSSLGADRVIDYTLEDFADVSGRYDVILDIAGNPSLGRLRRALEPHGTVVFVGGENAGALVGMGRQVRGLLLSPFVGQRLALLPTKESAEDYERLTSLIEAGHVNPMLDETFTLDAALSAVRRLEDGLIRGKVAITV